MKESDDRIQEIRKIREEHAKKFKYDLDAIVDDRKAREKKSGRKIVSLPPKPAV